MTYVLVLAIYTALGGTFDKPPHDFATFADQQVCEREAQRIRNMSEKYRHYVVACVPKESR